MWHSKNTLFDILIRHLPTYPFVRRWHSLAMILYIAAKTDFGGITVCFSISSSTAILLKGKQLLTAENCRCPKTRFLFASNGHVWHGTLFRKAGPSAATKSERSHQPLTTDWPEHSSLRMHNGPHPLPDRKQHCTCSRSSAWAGHCSTYAA